MAAFAILDRCIGNQAYPRGTLRIATKSTMSSAPPTGALLPSWSVLPTTRPSTLQRDDALRRMGAHQRPQKLRHDARLGRACYWAEGQSRLEWPQWKAQMPAGVSARRSRFPPNGGLIIGSTSRGNRMTYMLASLRARVCWLACLLPVVNLLAVCAVKVWLRYCAEPAGGIQAKAPAPPPAH
jgi:hypothetical protein